MTPFPGLLFTKRKTSCRQISLNLEAAGYRFRVTISTFDRCLGNKPSHYLIQCWNIVNRTLRNKLQWNLDQNLYIFIQVNAFENVVWKMAAILSRPQCVNQHRTLWVWEDEHANNLITNDLNTLKPRQNGRHFADYIFKRIILNENVWITSKISLKFVPKGSINNIPSLVQMMAWRRPGDKPLSEPTMARLSTDICVTRPQWVKTSLIKVCLMAVTGYGVNFAFTGGTWSCR